MDIIKHTLWKAKQALVRPRGYHYYRWLLRNEFLSKDALNDINLEKRNGLLRYAMENVPYYKKRLSFLERGGNIADEDWLKIPILTRNDVVEGFDSLLAVDVKDDWLRLSTTGGSTGTPVKVYHDQRYPVNALGWRMVRWWGVFPSSGEANCWRALSTAAAKSGRTWRERIGLAKTRVLLNAADMSAEAMAEFVRQLVELKPAILQGYVGAIDALTEYVMSQKVKVPPPRAIWLTASPSTRPQRKRIEEAFGGLTYDQYGSCEVHYLAAECAVRNGLHVFTDARYVEVVDENGIPCAPGCEGRVLVTDLENKVFPLIRYAIGDRASFVGTQCECGRAFPLLNSVKGRVSDNLTLADGSVIPGEFLTTVFDDIPDSVSTFQVLQKKNGGIVIRAVARLGGKPSIEKTVADFSRRIVRERAKVSVEYCDAIPHDRGKIQYVVREV